MSDPSGLPQEAVEAAWDAALESYRKNAVSDRMEHPERMRHAVADALAAALPRLVEPLESRIEYGHLVTLPGQPDADPVWIYEPRGQHYASHQRTRHYRLDEPLLIDHWTDPDNRKPFPPDFFQAETGGEGQQNA